MALYIGSYEEGRAVLSTARCGEAGKPLCSSGRYRLHGDSKNGPLRISVETWKTTGQAIAYIHPDNTLEFVIDPYDLWVYSNSLTQMMGKILPVTFHRHATRRYRVGKPWDEFGSYRYRKNEIVKTLPEYFSGIKFNLNTLECINPRVDLTSTCNIDKEARKRWLADKRRFVRNLKVRARLGVVDAVFNKLKRNIDTYTSGYDWTNSSAKHLSLVNMMKRDDITNADIKDLIKRYLRPYHVQHLTAEAVTKMVVTRVEDDLQRDSIELRKAYGVFKSEQQSA